VNIEKHEDSEQKVTPAQANPGNKHLVIGGLKKLKTDNDK